MVSESICNWLKTQPEDQVDIEHVATPPECRVRDCVVKTLIEKAINAENI